MSAVKVFLDQRDWDEQARNLQAQGVLVLRIETSVQLDNQLTHWVGGPSIEMQEWLAPHESINGALRLPLVYLHFGESLAVSPDDTRIADLINLIQAPPRSAVVGIILQFQWTVDPLPRVALAGLAEAVAGCRNSLQIYWNTKTFANNDVPLLAAPDNVLSGVVILLTEDYFPMIPPQVTPEMKRIFAALGRSMSIKRICMNGVPASHSKIVAEMIASTVSLNYFCLQFHRGFHLSPSFQALAANTSVTGLNFRRCLPSPQQSQTDPGLSDKEAKALVTVLKQKFTLTSFSFHLQYTSSPEFPVSVSLAKWPEIDFYLGLNKNGRARLLSSDTEPTINEWIEHLAWKDASHILYYLQKKGPSILNLD